MRTRVVLYLIFIFLFGIFRNEIFDFFLPSLLPVLSKVVVVAELDVIVGANVGQPTARHRFLVGHGPTGTVSCSASCSTLSYLGQKMQLKDLLYFHLC